MKKVQVGDIVCLKDRGDIHAEVVSSDGYNIKLKQRDVDGPYEYDATVEDVSLICAKIDTQKIQIASLERYAQVLGYLLTQDGSRFQHIDYLKVYARSPEKSFMQFNKMVELHNAGSVKNSVFKYANSRKLVDRVKIQYCKKTKTHVVQNNWVKYI